MSDQDVKSLLPQFHRNAGCNPINLLIYIGVVEKRGTTAASIESQGQRMLLENKLQGGGTSLLRNCVVLGARGMWGFESCEGRKSRSQLKQLKKDNSCISSEILRRCCSDTF